MDIKEEDFPLYQLIVKLGQRGVEMAIADFKKAQTGGDEEKFQFALGMQSVAIRPLWNVPGLTKEMKEKTIQSCLAVFKDCASHGHIMSAFMVADYVERGIGGGSTPAAKPQNPKFKPF